ncbi:autotransporter outer membrane beta-barrel domain-containing protein, partial [Desulfovibrio sp. 1214_IL3152]
AGAAITQRTSIAQPDGNGMQSVSLDKTDGVNKKGMALWIMPLYQSQNAWSMEAGNNYDLKWHGGLGGVALGGDYTFDNALRAGIAFNIGGGYAEGEGDLAKTTNSFNFWGLGAYAGWAVENFGLTADVNYTSTYNKVKQELPGAMQMRDLKSDITAYALSTGLRAEYKLNTQYVDIIPHLGVRYMYVNTNSYDVKSNGTVMHGDEMNQNIWTFPIGVTFSKQVETGSGWYVKPSLDLGVIPATGDIEAKSKIRFTGTGTKAELDTHTMDYMSYTGGLGLDFGNDNLSLGVNYNIQASEHSTSHGVFGTVRYEF